MTLYTDEQKAEAVQRAAETSVTAAGRELGISKSAISVWMKAAGVTSTRAAHTHQATLRSMADLELRKQHLAHGLMDDIFRLRGQLFTACVEKVVKTVNTGAGCSDTEIVTVDHAQPPFGDKQRIMVSIGIAVDKIQLLSGAATERVEHRGLPDDQAALHLRDELAGRRQAKTA